MSKTPRPFDLQGWQFEQGGGAANVDGKVYWPDCMTVKMNRWHAFDVVHRILSQIQDDELPIHVSLCGQMLGPQDDEETRPLRLGATAPDLLAACSLGLEFLDTLREDGIGESLAPGVKDLYRGISEQMRDAIAKARGKE
jgi:hypothetical protein